MMAIPRMTLFICEILSFPSCYAVDGIVVTGSCGLAAIPPLDLFPFSRRDVKML